MDRTICLDCVFHSLDRNAKCIKCQKILNSVVDENFWCPDGKNPGVSISATLMNFIFPPVKKKINGMIDILPKRKPGQNILDHIQEVKDSLSIINEIKRPEIERINRANTEAEYRLFRLNIKDGTCKNYETIKTFLVKRLLDNKDCDDLTLTIICDWNYSEIARLEKLQKQKQLITASKIRVKTLIDNLNTYFIKDTCISRAHSIGFDDGSSYYMGYGIISVELKNIDSLQYVVIVYDKNENNNGYGEKCLKLSHVFNKLSGYNADYPLVMQDNSKEEVEMIEDWSHYWALGLFYLFSNEELKIIL